MAHPSFKSIQDIIGVPGTHFLLMGLSSISKMDVHQMDGGSVTKPKNLRGTSLLQEHTGYRKRQRARHTFLTAWSQLYRHLFL